MASRVLKCASVKQYANGSIKECNQSGRPEYDYFCCMEHQVAAKEYVGEDAYNAHINTVNTVVRKQSLYHAYNTQVRPAFASTVMAGKSKEEAEFLLSVGKNYTQQAKNAWNATETVLSNPTANEIKAMTDEVTITQQNVKRKQTEDMNLSKLLVTDGGSPTKKTKAAQQVSVPIINLVQRGERILRSANQQSSIPSSSKAPIPPEIHITDNDRRRAEQQMQEAVNAPLPDDDDDLGDDRAPMSV